MDTIFVIMRPDGTPFHRDDAMGILATDSEAQAIRFQHAREDEGAEYVRYTRAQPPSAASVSERARELLAQAERGPQNDYGTVHRQIAHRAIEQALTQQRGEPVAWRYVHVIDGDSGSWQPMENLTPAYRKRLTDDGCEFEFAYAATTPQPSADAVREGYYLASFKRSHDRGYVTWWMADNSGYTSDLNQAGIYTELTPGYHDSEYTVPVPVSFIDRLRVRRMVDVGDSDNRALWTANDLRAALTNELESLLYGGSHA